MKRIFLFVSALAAVALIAYLMVAGARLGAASVFLVIAALVLVLSIYLMVRAGISLVLEPEAAEVQVATGRRRKELERDKQSLLKALKELEFDHRMGKLSVADYNVIAARYRGRAIAVMRQLDEAGGDYKRLIERDLAERRKRAGAKPTQASPTDASSTDALAADVLETGAPSTRASSTRTSSTQASGFRRWACSSCETSNDEDALFCKRCGRAATQSEAR